MASIRKEDTMQLRPIKTEQDYIKAIDRLEEIFDAQKGSPEGDELEILGILIEKYEEEQFPMDMPDPVEAIKFRLEQLNYDQNDLADIIGLKSRASEILNRKRKLSLNIIRKLSARLHIPTEVLIQAY